MTEEDRRAYLAARLDAARADQQWQQPAAGRHRRSRSWPRPVIVAAVLVVLAAALVLILAGCGGSTTTVVERTVTATATPSPAPAVTSTRPVPGPTVTRTVTANAGYTLPCYVDRGAAYPLLQPAGTGPWQELTCSASIQDVTPQYLAEEDLTITAPGYGSETYLVTVPGT